MANTRKREDDSVIVEVDQTFHEETGNVIGINMTQRRKAQLTKENRTQSGISVSGT